jgi:GntR family transcriptional regulator
MYIRVETRSSTPIYSQIKEQLRLAVATGVLQPGDQLPTVRELATQLRVNPNTVARAYRELRAEGMLNSRQGSGTFVSDRAAAIGQEEQRRILGEMLMQAATTAANLGLSPREFRKLTELSAKAMDEGFEGGEQE